ncbi:hypothetical protein NL533_31765, partial [Klebsiella pneumoniae]|nr:hypothetical protein [Klebsiella pneumoniae]
ALEEAPWFGDVYEFHFLANYEYNFFRKVNRAAPQLHSTYNTHIFGAGLDFTAPDTWNWEAEIEFAKATHISTGYRSTALQIRKLWLDDV